MLPSVAHLRVGSLPQHRRAHSAGSGRSPEPPTPAYRPFYAYLAGIPPANRELERFDATGPPKGRRQRAPRRFASLPPRPGEHITRPDGEPRRRSPQGAPAPGRDTVQTGGDGAGRGSPSAKTRLAASKQTRVGPRPGAGPGRKRKSPSRGFPASIEPAVHGGSRQFVAGAGSSWREPAARGGSRQFMAEAGSSWRKPAVRGRSQLRGVRCGCSESGN